MTAETALVRRLGELLARRLVVERGGKAAGVCAGASVGVFAGSGDRAGVDGMVC